MNISNVFKLVSTSSVILGFSFVLRFALTIALARFLSADQLGVYSWAVTVFGILGIIVNFGLDFFLIRKIPEYRNLTNGMAGAVIKHVQKLSSVIAFFTIIIILPISYFSVSLYDSAALYNKEVAIIIFALPFAAFSLIFSTSLRAYDFPIRAQLIESILQTGVLLLLILILFGFFGDYFSQQMGTLYLVFIFVFSWITSLIFSYLTYKREIKLDILGKPSTEEVKEWKRDQGAIVFGVLGWSFLGRSDIFLLAFLVSPADVGAYFICLRLAETLMFFATVSYYVWGGEISNLIQNGKLDKAQDILRKSTQLCISTTVFMTFFGWYFAEDILYIVNERYIDYINIFYAALCVFFLKGSVGILNPLYYILGDQEFLAKLQWLLGSFFALLVIIFVPIYGIEGCIAAFGLCEVLYVLTLINRLTNKHNLGLFTSPAARKKTIDIENQTKWVEWLGIWGSGKTSSIHKLIEEDNNKYLHSADFFNPLKSKRNLRLLKSPYLLFLTIRLFIILLPYIIKSFFMKDMRAISEYRSFLDCYLARLECLHLNSNRTVLWEGEIHMLPALNLSKKSLLKALNIILKLSKKNSLSFILINADAKKAFDRRHDNIPHLGHPRFKPEDNISLTDFKNFTSLQNYLVDHLKEKGFQVYECEPYDSSIKEAIEKN